MPTIEITFGARVSGTWICTCRSMRNTKPSRLFASIGERCASRLCAVETASAQLSVRIDVGTISAAYTRGLIGYLPVRSGSCQMPRWPGRTIEPNLNSAPDVSSVGRPTYALIDRDLALVHDEHRHHVDAHEERVQQVRAVEQRVVLQTDLAAGVEERLEVLVVVVQRVLAAEQHLDDLGVDRALRLLHRSDVVEAAEAARDVAERQRLTFERGDDADDVLRSDRRDHHDLELLGREPERLGRSTPPEPRDVRDEVGRHGQAVDLARSDDHERDRVDREAAFPAAAPDAARPSARRR